jgi:O-acetyl-ADP-ribose deacetylase (regulator of RNase III)
MGGGVSAAVRRAGGPNIAADASKMVPARPGDVIVSTAGDLPAKYIFHAITIGPKGEGLPAGAIVRQASQRVMHLLRALGCASAAFPAIGAGVAGIPYETVAAEMAGALVGFLLDSDKAYDIELYLMDRFGRMTRDDFFSFFEAFAARKFGLSTSSETSSHILKPPVTGTPVMDAEQTAEAERRHQIYMMLRHLDVRRNQIEAELLHSLFKQELPDRSLLKIREQLDEIRSLRHSYEAELVAGETNQGVLSNSVFVSSTSEDLGSYRLAVRGVINKLCLTFIGMEEFDPTVRAPVDLIRQKVNEAEVYLGILGMRYGYVDPGTGLSMTELEYRQAIASGKDIFMFVMDKNAPILASMVENDPSRYAKLVDFRTRIEKAHTSAHFLKPADLAERAEAVLRRRPHRSSRPSFKAITGG